MVDNAPSPTTTATPVAPAPRPSFARRTLRRGAWAAGTVALLAGLGGFAAVQSLDGPRARDAFAVRASAALGRPVTLGGELRLQWTRPGPDQAGLARWLPWPQWQAADLSIGPAPEGPPGALLRAESLRVTLQLLPLLGRRLVLERVEIDGLDLDLRRGADGRANWTLPPGHGSSDGGWTLQVRELRLHQGRIRLDDRPLALQLEARVESSGDDERPLVFDVSGRYRGQPLRGQGRTGNLLAFHAGASPLPMAWALSAGPRRLAIDGVVRDARWPAVFDLKLELATPSLAELYAFTGVALPETPPAKVSGTLEGRREGGMGVVRYREFNGQIGGTDLAGTLELALAAPRPRLGGKVHARQLRLADLGPSIGASAEGAPARRDRVLPTERFRVERLDAMDAQVEFSADRFMMGRREPAEAVQATLRVAQGRFLIEPLRFRLAGGSVSGKAELDPTGGTPRVRLQAQVEGLQPRRFAPEGSPLRDSLGRIDGQWNLSGQGDSIAAMAATADGQVLAVMKGGSFSKLLLEEAGLNLGNVVLSKLFGDRQVRVRCLAAGLEVQSGVARVATGLLDTDEAHVQVQGSIDLRSERLDLTVRPEQKTLRILTLRAPFHVRGTLAQPQVSPDALLVARAAGALVLAPVAPLAALVPLMASSGGDPEQGCASIKGMPAAVAPAPAKAVSR